MEEKCPSSTRVERKKIGTIPISPIWWSCPFGAFTVHRRQHVEFAMTFGTATGHFDPASGFPCIQ
jgi:hypothetical protein